MHALEPKHTKLGLEETKKLLNNLTISTSQLPKIKVNDPVLPSDCKVGEVVKIERNDDGKTTIYYRVVSI